MEQTTHEHYVQVGLHTMRLNGDCKLTVPLYMQVSDDRAYHAQRDKCLHGISQMVIERYRERLQTAEGYANG